MIIDVTLRRIVLALPLVLVAALPAWGAARNSATRAAAERFDGRWSVVIITDAGTCDRAYRYRVRIDAGRVFYDGGEGGSGATVSGEVDPRGRVSVSVRSGASAAFGSGQLGGSTGEGRWQGTSQNSRCSGHWEAEREGESTGAGH